MMKPQCLGQGGEIPTRRDSRASLVMIIKAAQQDAVNQIKCDECNRLFRRESDKVTQVHLRETEACE